ncbi:MAG TPA: cobalt ECF transporter T component CbiQ [Longimicrobiales bacterium]|nr:cobalt ECF transporter T component CbiQ [Longimicrobiales bacterium]
MGFHHLDQYAHSAGPLTRTPPAARVLATVLLAVGAALLPLGAWLQMVVLGGLVLALARIGHVPLATLLARSAPPLLLLALASAAVLVLAPGQVIARVGPLAVTDAGLERVGSALGRGTPAILAGVLLISTTRFPDLVEGLRELRLPLVVTAALGLAYRFLYLLADELTQLQRAAASRNARAGAVPRRRLLAGITASALVRSLARSERVHRAMLARGFTGELLSLHRQPLDREAWRNLGILGVLVALVVLSARVG